MTSRAITLKAWALGMIAALAAVPGLSASKAAGSGRVYRTQLPGRASSEALLGAAVSADGTVWVSDQRDEALIAIGPGGRRHQVALGAQALLDIEDHAGYVWTVGAVYASADGSVYVAERGALARVTHGRVRTYRIPGGRYASPAAFATGPDGGLWFTEVNRPYIGRFDPTRARITQFRDGTGANGIAGGGTTAGPDGRLWYTLPGYYRHLRGEIGAISTSGRTSVYGLAADGLLQAAWGIVADRGTLWVLGSRLGAAPRGQPQSGLLRVQTGSGRPVIERVGASLGPAVGELALAPGGTFYAVGGALGASGEIVSVNEHGVVRRFGHANGQVALFGTGANPTPLVAAADGSVWLGADDGVLEHLLHRRLRPASCPASSASEPA